MGVAARTFASSAAVIGASSLAVEPQASPIDDRRSGSNVRLDPRTARMSASATVSRPDGLDAGRAELLERRGARGRGDAGDEVGEHADPLRRAPSASSAEARTQ